MLHDNCHSYHIFLLFIDPVCLARYHDAFHAVQFHPVEPVFVVTANSREGVSLWDVRKPRV